jgi:hypothetical protein
MYKIGYYLFSFNNTDRKKRMIERFEKENITPVFVPDVVSTDSRLIGAPQTCKRNWSIMWNHIDMLKEFLESDNTHAIFCEDDVHIRKGLTKYIPELVAAYNRRGLEILLLGYLSTLSPVGITNTKSFTSSDINLIYMTYEDNLWGSHMYMLDRATAEKFVSIYTVEYSRETLVNQNLPHFSPDWTLTKNGRRALVYPMMGVEEGLVATTDMPQQEFHKACHTRHYDSNNYW